MLPLSDIGFSVILFDEFLFRFERNKKGKEIISDSFVSQCQYIIIDDFVNKPEQGIADGAERTSCPEQVNHCIRRRLAQSTPRAGIMG
jgi:hypothetical protein